jgi:DNA-binding transcriptional LysR family regulator
MDLRHLRTFVTVAEVGTVSKAALRLRIAQPALSRQIASLEEELGVPLFDRVGGRLLLSGAGERLLGDCRGLLNYARELGEHAQRLRLPDQGVLKVAASPHFIEGVLPDLLQRYAKRFPRVEVKVVDVVGPIVISMLERGEIHLAQSSVGLVGPQDRHIAARPLQSVEMLAACHPGLDLGKGGTVEIEKLAPYPLLHTGPEYVMRRMFDAACRLAGFHPNIALECRAPHALLAMAEAGHGVAIIPSAMRTHSYRLRIVRVAYRRKVLTQPLSILVDSRRPQSGYAVAFCEMLADYVREVFPITRPVEPPVRRARSSGGEPKSGKAGPNRAK